MWVSKNLTMKTNALTLILISSFLVTEPFQPAQARSNECIGKICIGMSTAQVRDILGKPSNSSKGCTATTVKYAQGEISIDRGDGKVRVIRTQSSRWRTEKGIKVGDNISKAQKAYRLKKDDSSSFSAFSLTGTYLSFAIDKQGEITGISFGSVDLC
jgi:hypothetical protein